MAKTLQPIRGLSKQKMERKRKPSLLQQSENGRIGLGTGFNLKNIKIIGEAATAYEEAAAMFPAELIQNYQV
jgi:hypothetical protein